MLFTLQFPLVENAYNSHDEIKGIKTIHKVL